MKLKIVFVQNTPLHTHIHIYTNTHITIFGLLRVIKDTLFNLNHATLYYNDRQQRYSLKGTFSFTIFKIKSIHNSDLIWIIIHKEIIFFLKRSLGSKFKISWLEFNKKVIYSIVLNFLNCHHKRVFNRNYLTCPKR